MRIFWSIVALLALAATGLMLLRSGDDAPVVRETTAAAPMTEAVPAPAREADESLDSALGLAAEESASTPADAPRLPAPGAQEPGARAAGPDIPGAGTPEDPYRLNWDLLVSAERTYQPRLGREELPDWFETINGKHVKITGFLGLPLFASEVDELLVMKNQWDGCCLGVPPTPYDAVEVRLASSMQMQRFVDFGSISGRMVIEPYVRNNWLLGLYVIEEGALETGG